MKKFLLLVFVGLSACTSIRSPFDSALPSSELSVRQLSTLTLVEQPGFAIDRVLEKGPWQWRGRHALGAQPQPPLAPIFLGSNEALIGTLGGGIGVYDLLSGAALWKKEVPVGVASRPWVEGAHLFVAGMDGFVRKLRLDNGQSLWKVQVSAESTGAVVGGVESIVYVTADDNSLWALDSKSGRALWTYKRPTPNSAVFWSLRGSGRPLLSKDGSRLYAGFSDGVFVALEAVSGRTLWERNFTRAGRFQDADQVPLFLKDDSQIALPLVDGDLVVLSAADGRTLWKIEWAGAASPLIEQEESALYTVSNQGSIRKYNLEDNRLIWTQDLKGGHVSQPIALGKKYIAASTSLGGLMILDRESGQTIYRYRMGPGVVAPPAYDGHRLLVMSSRNRLHQFVIESSLADKNSKEAKNFSKQKQPLSSAAVSAFPN